MSAQNVPDKISFVESSIGSEISTYSWYRNSSSIDAYKKSSGYAIYNIGIWGGFTLGTPTIGIMAHGRAAFNLTGFDFKENKGWSAYNYGYLGSLYINHPHDMQKTSILLSFGQQWNRTELWLKPKNYRSLHRPVYTTWVAQISLRIPSLHEYHFFIRGGLGKEKSCSIEGGLMILVDWIGHWK